MYMQRNNNNNNNNDNDNNNDDDNDGNTMFIQKKFIHSLFRKLKGRNS